MTTIREQLLAREIVVTNRGRKYTFTLPNVLDGLTPEILDDEELLVDWCKEQDILQRIIHTGFRQFVIDCRAPARPQDKDGTALDYTTEIVQSIQDKLNHMLPGLLAKPGGRKKDPKETIQDYMNRMIKDGMTKEEVLAELASMIA